MDSLVVAGVAADEGVGRELVVGGNNQNVSAADIGGDFGDDFAGKDRVGKDTDSLGMRHKHCLGAVASEVVAVASDVAATEVVAAAAENGS